jgi:AhpD family alkylhydroperoxidase
MRLREIERGDTLRGKSLIRIISFVAGIRLPDAARVAFYDKDFVSGPLGSWMNEVMRGPSSWSIGERELMAAMVARWNSCPFCVGAHSSIAVHEMASETVTACLDDYRTAPIDETLRAALVLLEVMTRQPNTLSVAHARAAIDVGVTVDQLADAAAVAALFNIVTRYANALDFAIPTDAEYATSAKMLLKRGYK